LGFGAEQNLWHPNSLFSSSVAVNGGHLNETERKEQVDGRFFAYFSCKIALPFVHYPNAQLLNFYKCIQKLFKTGRGTRKSNRGGKFDQSTLYTCMDYHKDTLCIINVC
jgi:hypothetical protein